MINKTFLDNIRTSLRRREKLGERIVINVTFLRGSSKDVLLDYAPIASLSQINKILKGSSYDRVKVDAYDISSGDKKLVKTQVLIVSDSQEENEGLSGIEMNKVERFIAKKEREREFEELKADNVELREQLGQLEIEVEELEEEVERLEGFLEQKKNSNNLGKYLPLLEGIAKGMGLDGGLAESLSGILAPNTQAIPEEQEGDSSGIVEEDSTSLSALDSPEQRLARLDHQRKAELIQLIVNSVMEKNYSFVSQFFSLYSELERKPEMLPQLIAKILIN